MREHASSVVYSRSRLQLNANISTIRVSTGHCSLCVMLQRQLHVKHLRCRTTKRLLVQHILCNGNDVNALKRRLMQSWPLN